MIKKATSIAQDFACNSFLDPAIKGAYSSSLIEILKKHNLMPGNYFRRIKNY